MEGSCDTFAMDISHRESFRRYGRIGLRFNKDIIEILRGSLKIQGDHRRFDLDSILFLSSENISASKWLVRQNFGSGFQSSGKRKQDSVGKAIGDQIL